MRDYKKHYTRADHDAVANGYHSCPTCTTKLTYGSTGNLLRAVRKNALRDTCSRKAHMTAETKKKISISLGGNGSPLKRVEKNAHQHLGNKVKKRDEYICQHCNYEGPDHLEAHHIIGRSKLPQYRYDMDNGITLCWTCHDVEHSKRTRKWLEET
jgi:5-methylcytosine-specific restriction endonuclease McrA